MLVGLLYTALTLYVFLEIKIQRKEEDAMEFDDDDDNEVFHNLTNSDNKINPLIQ